MPRFFNTRSHHTSPSQGDRKKLGLEDLGDWLESELNGYSCAPKDLPSHRKAYGDPKFHNPHHGWCALMTADDKFGEMVRTVYLYESVTELEQLVAGCKTGNLTTNLHPTIDEVVQKQLPFRARTAIHFPATIATGVLEFARNKTLDWALGLESRGIVGQDLTFDPSKRQEAARMTNIIYGGNVGVLGNIAGDVQNSDFTSVSNGVDPAELLTLVSRIGDSLDGLPGSIRQDVGDLAQAIESEATRSEPSKASLSEHLNTLQAILIGASGNLTAEGILAAIAGLSQI